MDFYWVLYQKGSFYVKEPFQCPLQAERRAEALRAQVWRTDIISPAAVPEFRRLLDRYIEIPAALDQTTRSLRAQVKEAGL